MKGSRFYSHPVSDFAHVSLDLIVIPQQKVKKTARVDPYQPDPSGDRGRGVSVLSVVFSEVVVGKKERARVERVCHLNVHVDVNVYIVE